MDRIYHLLAMIYPWKDVAAARWTLEHTTGRARAGALEYLDNLLTGQMRKRVMPVLDDVPLEEKVRRGNLLLKSRVRDVEDSLAQLVHDADQNRRGHRDPFRRVARAVGAGGRSRVRARAPRCARTGTCSRRRRGRWPHGAWRPTSGAAAGWSRCRRSSSRIGCGECALFDYVSVDELFRIADAGRQVRHEHGRVLYEQGATPDDLQFLLDGTVQRAVDDDGHVSRVEVQPPAPLAFEEVMEGAPSAATVTAVDRAICLALRNEQVLGAARRERGPGAGPLPHGHRARGRRGVARRRPRGCREACPAEAARRRWTCLQPVEKILLMEEVPGVRARLSRGCERAGGDRPRGSGGRG